MTNSFSLSRRGFLGATGASAALASSSAVGAFLPEGQMAPPLFGPPEETALLSRNENPYGPAPSALRMIEKAGKKSAYYPTEAGKRLAAMIAERHGIDPEQVVITTGSGEALSAIALAYGPEGPVVAPRLFWDTTALYAERLGRASIARVPLTDDMALDLPAIEKRVSEGAGLVQLCNPNNPTGLAHEPEAFKASVTRMAKTAPVIVDEAYIELMDDPDAATCIPLINEGHDVIVTRTFSKIYGMAGVRVGYAIASPERAETIRQAAMSWISVLGLAAALGSYNDEAFLAMSKSKIVEARQMVNETLAELELKALPSQTNFVYFETPKGANAVQAALAEKNVSIRGQYMDYASWSRVSMGLIPDVERFCSELPKVVAS